MAKFFLKSEIESVNDDFYFLKNKGIFKKNTCKIVGKRIYPLDRQFYKTEPLQSDDLVKIVNGAILHTPCKIERGEVSINELFETARDS